MKLKEPVKEQNRGFPAVEVLVPAQVTPQFDLLRDVPPEMWEGLTKKVEDFIKTPSRAGVVEDFGIMAQISPAFRDQLRQRPAFVTTLKRVAHDMWDKFATYDARQLKGSAHMIGDCLSILPELRDELTPISDEQLQAILSLLKEEMITGKGTGYQSQTKIPFRFSAGVLISLFRLLPNKRHLLRDFLDDQEFKQGLDTRMNSDLQTGEDWSIFLMLADASLLYPDRADQYKQQAAAYWGAVKQEISISGPKLDLMIKPIYLLWAAQVVAADKSFIDQNGDLRCEDDRLAGTPPVLPSRLVT